MEIKEEENKGFSLVELVVVVLIMGVISVSLAPQVMKWVGKAEASADVRVRDTLKSIGQAAVAEYESEVGDISGVIYLVTSTGFVVSGGGADPNNGMIAILDEAVGGEYPKVKSESGKVFQVSISSTGAVTISKTDGTY